MGSRRKAREVAVQFLYSRAFNDSDMPGALEAFWSVHAEIESLDEATRAFATDLITGTLGHLDEIDRLVATYTINWELDRIALVDRSILRLGIFEMLHRDDIPPVVSINEAVDIAKKFSTDESGKFVNGILDKVKIEVVRR